MFVAGEQRKAAHMQGPDDAKPGWLAGPGPPIQPAAAWAITAQELRIVLYFWLVTFPVAIQVPTRFYLLLSQACSGQGNAPQALISR